MDIECIPPPPPEEFEEPGQYSYASHYGSSSDLHEVPLPPGETSSPINGYGTNMYNIGGNSSASDNRGMEWQRAMEALNQSNPTKASPYTSFASPYASYANYGYGSQYTQSYPTSAYSVSQPSSVYPNYAVQYAQAQTSANVNNSTRLPTPSFPSRTSNIRSRFSKPKVTPYGLVSVSETKEANKPQTIYQTPAQPQSYSVYAPLLPTPGTHEGLAGSGKVTDSNNVETSGQMDMEWEDDTGTSSGSLPAYASYSQNNPQKHGSGAGGIRFQLSKKAAAAEVKVSNPLLQRRHYLVPQASPSLIQPQRLSFGNDYEAVAPSAGPSPVRKSRFSAAEEKPKQVEASAGVHSKDWPPSLQDYVTRAIGIAPIKDREKVMQVITQMITNAYKTDTLNTVKWENAPMPYANETATEFFGLSPKRENEAPTRPHTPSSYSSSSSMSRGRGRGGFRRGRTSARRDSESEEGSPLRNGQLSGSRARNRNSDSALIKKASEEDSEPEFIALNGASLKGKKGKLTLKNARGKPAGASVRGKLMSFGVEAPMSAAELEKLRRRQERFGDLNSPGDAPTTTPSPTKLSKKVGKNKLSPCVTAPTVSFRNQNNANNQRKVSAIRTVVGTCETIEKDYFRLTDEVDPTQVRPVHILEESLKLVREKWKKSHDYRYAESQLKSIRQDLRVQHVFSAFTVNVYETHARIALEVGDQAEFTQCLSQLEWLYDTLAAVARAKGGVVPGEEENGKVTCIPGCENRREFLSYRILYVMRQNRTTDAAKARMQLSTEDKKDICIAFAFSVLSAYFAGDYQQFFTMYKVAPKMASYVMDVAVPQFRQKTLIKICTAYRPNLPVNALKDILNFSNDKDLREFLKNYQLVYTWINGSEEIDTKASLAVVKAGPEAVVDSAKPKPSPIQHKPTKIPGPFRIKAAI